MAACIDSVPTITVRHYGTYASAIHGFSPQGRKKLSTIRKQLYPSLPKAVPSVKQKGLSVGLPRRKKVLGGMFTYDEELQSYLLVRAVKQIH
jgi:hypothetical protein